MKTVPIGSCRLSIACVGMAIAAGAQTVHGADPQWPASPDFANQSIIPNQALGATYHGWIDQGGGLITNAGPDGDQLWQLTYARGGETTIVIVVPEGRSADGSVESWQVRTTLLMDDSTAVPMTWEACELVSGRLQPVYARWAPGLEPTGIWAFDPESARFEHLSPQQVTCSEYGRE